jgi:phosphatidate cytidylyltransferase
VKLNAAALGADLGPRLLSGIVMAAIALAGAYFGGLLAGLVVAVAAVIVHTEWANVTRDSPRVSIFFAIAVAAAIVVGATGRLTIALAIGAAAVIVAAATARRPWRPAGVLYSLVFGLGLIAICLSAHLPFTALLFLFAVVWATDSGAFFAGRLIGGSKLWPRISPKKTWAGAIGGLMAALVGGIAVVTIAGLGISVGLVVVIVVLSVFSQCGDLFESWVKRVFETKDASHLIPGHGGLLDRVDGLTFAAGLAALIGFAHGGPGEIARGLLLW